MGTMRSLWIQHLTLDRLLPRVTAAGDGDADRGDLGAKKDEMNSHLLCGAWIARCLKATRSECSEPSAIEYRMGETRAAIVSSRVRCSGLAVILVLGAESPSSSGEPEL